jgi:uncharacterized protein (DUF885 family)
MKKKLRVSVASLLIGAIVLCGCSTVCTSGDSAETAVQNMDSTRFDVFTQQLFVDTVSTDALTLHYELVDPSAYDISLDEVNLGRIDLAYTSDDTEELEDILRELHGFNYDDLTSDQQLTYDILDAYVQTQLAYDSEALYYYPEPLSSTSGTHSMLPILMSEYQFYNKDDIEVYLTLLNDVPAYFDNILAYEQAKSDAGLFMSDESVEEVVDACETFIETPSDNMLLEIFPEKLETVDNLSEAEIADFTARNEQAVLESVIPAYQTLIDGLNDLKGTGKNENGLYYFENGKEYYQYLVATQTGSDQSPEDLIELLEDTMDTDITKMAFILMSNEDLYAQLDEDYDITLSDPNQILSALQDSLQASFPDAITDQYTLKYVPECLEDSMNPAFYMIPPVDAPNINTIYINNSQISDNISLFTTLAHEGYPGHLYQQTYFSSTDPDPIRQELSFLGYVEGWATYVELMSYEWCGLDSALAKCLQINQELTLCLYARIDLGIHYEGWTEADVLEFLTDYGIDDEESAHAVFRAIVVDPASYLPYCIGSLEFKTLCDNAQEALEDDFNLNDFHEVILETGPCQFNILEKQLENALNY